MAEAVVLSEDPVDNKIIDWVAGIGAIWSLPFCTPPDVPGVPDWKDNVERKNTQANLPSFIE